MAELEKLLGFMSSWDRQDALKQYAALFDEAEDEEALIEKLGTPTKQAIELARSYVPSPAPAPKAEPETPAEAESAEEVPEQISWDLDPEPETSEEAAPVTVRKLSGGVLAAYLVPAIVIGLPVTVLLVCIGLPFLAAGAALITAAVKEALTVIAALSLVSDILLTAGAALALCALGLVLCWLGLWISMELCYLWTAKVVVALGKKLCVKEVSA